MKLTDTEMQQIAHRTERVLQSISGLRLAFLYGSVATGKMRSDSDVDVAVLFDRPLDSEQKMKLVACLQSGLSMPVDLVDLFSLNGTILKQILCKGRLLVKRQSGDLAALLQRMTYNQADMMPYVYRTLNERQERFVHG